MDLLRENIIDIFCNTATDSCPFSGNTHIQGGINAKEKLNDRSRRFIIDRGNDRLYLFRDKDGRRFADPNSEIDQGAEREYELEFGYELEYEFKLQFKHEYGFKYGYEFKYQR